MLKFTLSILLVLLASTHTNCETLCSDICEANFPTAEAAACIKECDLKETEILKHLQSEDLNERKRALSSFVRIGRALSSFVRIGRNPEKRLSSFVRIGKSQPVKEMNNFVGIDDGLNEKAKRMSSFVRIGKNVNLDDEKEKRMSSFVRIGKRPMSSFVRIGRSTK
ncbi:unnamed protein product [Dimorphilus gyrociliatus]|uniref:Uncharacterized protein n=1 Tax=Dimorphilus gyrociliatus TaxID=2664684 RepID=A0A7I8WAX7_9ANNE|nr:unnamed protein product [Dimorphilus gyrociliatus]